MDRLLIFDLDGTLVDTNRDLIPALNHAIAHEKVEPVSTDEVGHVVGQGARQMIEKAFELRGRDVPRDRLDTLHERFLTHYEAHIADRSRPYPGVLEAMDRLERNGWAFAICTNTLEHLSRRLLDALDIASRFAAIIGADSVPSRKPDPDHIRLTARAAAIDVERAVMVGDSINDIKAAKAVPMPVVAVDFGYTDVPVARLDPDAIISHYDDLPTAVERLMPREAT